MNDEIMLAQRAATWLTTAFGARAVARKPKKPPEILYGVEDVPPLSATLLSAFQHTGNVAISVVTPLAILHHTHVAPEIAASVVGISFLALALAVVIQALPRGPVGSGYLAPSMFSGLFVTPSVAAIEAGGLPLMGGMTVFAGLLEAALSRVIRHLRPFLPPEIAGTVTFLLGINGGILGLRNLLGVDVEGVVPHTHYLVGAFTLGLIVVLNVWTTGLLRMSCVLIGFVAGYVAALATGLLSPTVFTANPAPMLAIPTFQHSGLAFDIDLVLPFLVAALVSSIKAIAVITTCQRTNDAAYIRPDLTSINRGVLADGLITAMGGLMGGGAINAAASSPGLAAATGVTSRRVAYAIGALLALLAFSPAAASVFSAIPDAVGGAILVFSSCFIITSGVEVMASRLLDSRRMLVIACAILAAEGAHTVAARAESLPGAVQQITASPLLLGTVVALILNVAFRPGMRRNSALMLDAGALDTEAIHTFIDGRGAAWGARPDVIQRVGFVLAELVESLVHRCKAEGPIRVTASFNEFRVDLVVTYRGVLMPFPLMRPSLDEIADTPDGLLRLSGFLIRRQTDSVRATERNGACVVEMHFDH
ncbi:MAG TPA: solute carrier family 23 protein [Acetobacteraceae bacterium]|nr:solute carrier family 23 protein [Acetobacteraceae bacterium]